MNAKRVLFQVCFFAALGLSITCTSIANTEKVQPPAGAEVVETPVFQVGNFWRYTYTNKKGGFSYTVVEVNDDGMVLSSAAGTKTGYSKEGNILSGYGPVTGQPVTYDPAIPRLQFPLWVDKQWSVSYTARSGSWSERSTLDVKVVGKENITIPAGAFKTLKLKLRFSSGNQEVCWYAVEVKRFVKCQYADSTRDYELAAFRLKPLF